MSIQFLTTQIVKGVKSKQLKEKRGIYLDSKLLLRDKPESAACKFGCSILLVLGYSSLPLFHCLDICGGLVKAGQRYNISISPFLYLYVTVTF